MSVLNFHLEINADPSWVPYIKEILAHRIGNAGHVLAVVYEEQLTDMEAHDELAEYENWKAGKIEL